jgi:hypothetical protein
VRIRRAATVEQLRSRCIKLKDKPLNGRYGQSMCAGLAMNQERAPWMAQRVLYGLSATLLVEVSGYSDAGRLCSMYTSGAERRVLCWMRETGVEASRGCALCEIHGPRKATLIHRFVMRDTSPGG